eukprot:CAMPEP_0176485126 /NCGR_PEP_ID=MMETSP0200_2-20121128/4875_1 /TAXON_ID=947934 /ORGANISM="Chaetoceros sp., Strain GSL56" /LENGTH=520 /DNA_ID=CAMNT_0017881753 /DNA_START=442 /DNA_END=2004 /DNA_ORIENTATION=+
MMIPTNITNVFNTLGVYLVFFSFYSSFSCSCSCSSWALSFVPTNNRNIGGGGGGGIMATNNINVANNNYYNNANNHYNLVQSSLYSPQRPPLFQNTQPSSRIVLSPFPAAEADRAFRYASSLESAGLPRTAHAAYHEAATLFQCSLDSTTEFAHVTDIKIENDVRSYLAYCCTRLAFLSHDALSDPKAALRLYKEAAILDVNHPSAEAYDGIGMSIEGCLGDRNEAVEAYEMALKLLEEEKKKQQQGEAESSPPSSSYGWGVDDNSGFVKFHLGIAMERLGKGEESEEIMENLRRSEAKYACLVDSWGYIRWHTRRIPDEELNLYLGTRDMLRIGLDAAMDMIQNQGGLVCEFGVAKGRSMRMMQELLPLETPLHGFDTFTGLPLPWNSLPAGAFSTNGDIPNIEGEVYFHRGLFRDSIPEFLNSLEAGAGVGGEEYYRPLAFANIDALLYGSTLDILECVHSRVVPGTVFVFADYTCHPTWRQDEFRAWRECCKRFGWTYEYLGFSLATKQAVVRVTSA